MASVEWNHILLFVVALLAVVPQCLDAQLLEGLYCGKENCYDVLNVTRDATKAVIARSYRVLAKKHHPDLQRSAEAKFAAAEMFKTVANAYEILKDDESRTDYNYMLDNPDEYYAHYYRYYRRRVAPQVDIRLVIFVTVTIISVIQYYSACQRYDTAIKYFASVPKYRNRALDIAKEEQLLVVDRRDKRSKAEQKEAIEKTILKVIEDKMDIKGAYAKPTLWDVLFVQLIICPYTLVRYLYWYATWIWQHTILHKPYDRDEKLYLIRKHMGVGQHQFNSIEDEKVEEYLTRELHVKDNFRVWKAEEEELAKKQLAENTRYKQYRRYMKNHGPGRMTFDDS